jgi:hypothetical protein
VAPLLLVAGAVPVYRRQDGLDTARNLDAFRRCRSALARGEALLLFPEGTSHSHPYRLPLKTGAARIALGTVEGQGPLGLRVVPVGLRYEAKGEFRSRVFIQVGEPLDPSPERERYAREGRAAVRALTTRIAHGLDAVAHYGEGSAGQSDPAVARRRRGALLAAAMVVGVALNWLPYRLPGWIAQRLARRPDDPATYKLLAALLTFPAAWTLEVVAAGSLGGAAAAVAVALLAPLTGLAALRYWGRPGFSGGAASPSGADSAAPIR